MNALPETVTQNLSQEVQQILQLLDQIEEHASNIRKKLLAELRA